MKPALGYFSVLLLILGLLLAACSDNNGNATAGVTQTTSAAAVATSAAPAAAITAASSPSTTTATTTKNTTAAPAGAVSADQVESNSVVGVVKRLSPAVVTIYNKATRTGVSGGEVTRATGSGVIISQDGYILTNAHVVSGQQGLTVAFNNGQDVAQAKLIGADDDGDIAIIKVDVKVPAVATFGNSDKLEVGETVVAIGAALGDYRNSVTKGVVSGLNRTIPGDTSTTVYVQTDAPINHGNSGGPLLNLKGEIIGINTAVLRSTSDVTGSTRSSTSDLAEGLGFAIPGNTAKVLADQLMAKGSVSRPYFGITYNMITPATVGTTLPGITIPAVEGAWINTTRGSRQPAVVPNSPADKGGLKENDVITAINGETLNDANPLVSVMLKYKPNDTVKLTVRRGDQTLSLTVTLGERPKS